GGGRGGNSMPAVLEPVAFKASHYTRGKDGAPSQVVAPLSADADKGDQDTLIAHTSDGGFASTDSFQGGSQQDQILGEDAVCPALCHSSNGNKGHHQPKVIVPYTKAKRAQSASDDESWKHGEVSPTLNHFDVGDTRATTVVAFTQNQRDEVRDLGDAAGTLNGPGTHQSTYVAEAFSVREDAKAGNFSATPTDVGLAVQAHQPSVQSHHAQIFVAQPMAVRRLTPRECERLQGFPDHYTLIPWRKKPAEDCPDGPRYRALGNSMAVPVMRWIGERIEAVDRIPSNPSGEPHVH
ncbi:MAG: DNA cytosine methyltransferase, partial [Phycisphaerales bacterium]